MSNGFLDNLPDVEFGPDERPKKRPKPKPESRVVHYIRVRCPYCGYDKCPVYSSRDKPVRYHKCQKCGKTFKSIEIKP